MKLRTGILVVWEDIWCWNIKEMKDMTSKKTPFLIKEQWRDNSSLINLAELSVDIWVAEMPKRGKRYWEIERWCWNIFPKITVRLTGQWIHLLSVQEDGRVCSRTGFNRKKCVYLTQLWTAHLLIPWASEGLCMALSEAPKLHMQSKRVLEMQSTKNTSLR